MCKLRTKHYSTYVGGANTTNLGLWYLSKIITHGKIAWASNINPKELNFHIFIELPSITKRGRLKGPCLVFGN
jgi:hypothetical protein